jgi:hypothetical protein
MKYCSHKGCYKPAAFSFAVQDRCYEHGSPIKEALDENERLRKEIEELKRLLKKTEVSKGLWCPECKGILRCKSWCNLRKALR